MIRPLALLLLAVPTCMAHAQLMNAGFESVTITSEDTLPDDWQVVASFGGGVVDHAHSGAHALGVWNWYYYAEGIARSGTTGRGTPIAATPVRLLGWYTRQRDTLQAGLSPNDSAEVRVVLTRWNTVTDERDTVAEGVMRLGEQAEWAPFHVDIVPRSNETPDSITVQLLSGVDCFCATPMGYCCYLFVDDLVLESAQGVREPLPSGDALRLLPAGDGWTVRTEAQLPFAIVLRDMAGRTVWNTTITERSQRIAWPSAPGVYTFVATASGRILGRGKAVRP